MSLLGQEITVTIDRLAGLGEGCGQWEGRKVFVPMTLAGDQVRAVVTQETVEFLRARLVAIDAPATDRIEPFCPHFVFCGSCSLQHLSAGTYADFKRRMLQEALRKAGYADIAPEPMLEIGLEGRRRVTWTVAEKNGELVLGFQENKSHEAVDIDECRVLVTPLQQLIHPLRAALKKLALARHIDSVQVLYLNNALDVAIVTREPYASALDASFVALGNALGASRLSVYRREGPKVLMEKRAITRTVDGMKIELPAFSFLQASEIAEACMIKEVARGMRNCRKIADLFCGMGTYSIPLTLHAHVTAFETVSWMTEALEHAVATHQLHQLKPLRRDLFRTPLTAQELSAYDGVVINPPREGAKEQCGQLAKSSVKKVVMLSCNPATFARDAKILRLGGYALARVVGIDQFAFTSHLEIVAHFQK